MAKEHFQLKLNWAEDITPGIKHLAFEKVNGNDLDYKAGQFISFHFTANEKELKRSYSIVTPPESSDLIEIAASYVKGGPATELLFGLKPGDVLDTSGPYGRLVLQEEDPKRYILIATGTGVTPYHAMLPELAKRVVNNQIEVDIVLGVQRRESLLYGDAFLDYANQYPGKIRFHACYSRDFPEAPESYEHSGRVHTIFDKLNTNPDQDIVYLCGNPEMIDQAFEYFKGKEFPVQRVRREKYISL